MERFAAVVMLMSVVGCSGVYGKCEDENGCISAIFLLCDVFGTCFFPVAGKLNSTVLISKYNVVISSYEPI